MLKRYAYYFVLFQSILDIIIISGTWVAVYFIRFYTGFFSNPKGTSDFSRHLKLAVPVTAIIYVVCLWSGLYRTKRLQNLFLQLTDVFKTCLIGSLVTLAFLYYTQDSPYSRRLLALFIPVLFIGLLLSHVAVRAVLRKFREEGYNLRHCAIIGTGKKGQQLYRDIESIRWLGIKCKYFIDNDPACIGNNFCGVSIYGPVSRTADFIEQDPVDEVYLSLSGDQAVSVYPILENIQQKGITVRIIPDWGHLTSMNATIVQIGSQVLFCADESRLTSYNIVVKEIFDRCAGFLLLAVFGVPMLVIAIFVKLAGRGPVFYKQARVGLDQKEFKIYKFRTMNTDAEEDNGQGWTQPDDNRRTGIGKLLRRFSLDELPQLINVIRGEMSLVGPRPERPYFVQKFSDEFRNYMLRHKVKAGITGWAQIHGFRGDTSLKKRLQYDLFYVRNWSFGLDLRILLSTPWYVIKGKNAY
jgi:exopolysaccharide biosynthesis polyprenyl glycosylphosphotransferase